MTDISAQSLIFVLSALLKAGGKTYKENGKAKGKMLFLLAVMNPLFRRLLKALSVSFVH